MAAFQEKPDYPIDFELRLNGSDGKVIGKGSILPQFSPGPQGASIGMIPIVLESPMDIRADELYFVYKPDTSKPKGEGFAALMNVNFGS